MLRRRTMPDFGINEMLDMQRTLQERYKDKWEGISPEVGTNKLLWMIGEVGEVIDIVKKYGPEASDADNPEREHLVEELADVLMYYNDVLLCYGISAEELKETYTKKFKKNMTRW
jgi:NTP pyrophosphatase (non-canonical NTP hydrolase)